MHIPISTHFPFPPSASCSENTHTHTQPWPHYTYICTSLVSATLNTHALAHTTRDPLLTHIPQVMATLHNHPCTQLDYGWISGILAPQVSRTWKQQGVRAREEMNHLLNVHWWENVELGPFCLGKIQESESGREADEKRWMQAEEVCEDRSGRLGNWAWWKFKALGRRKVVVMNITLWIYAAFQGT